MARHVLILDDNNDNLDLLSFSLTSLQPGYEIHRAAAGSEVAALLEKTHLDLALLDVELPDADGLTLAEQLRQHFPDIVLIMLSANDEMDKLERARQVGAHAYVVKPFNLSEIFKLIRETEIRAAGASSQMLVV
jgi:CheY-like chemotaxis protein